MGVSQKSHHQTKHEMSADVEVKQSPLKRNAVALERESLEANPFLFGEGEPLEVNPIRFGEGKPLEANPIRLGEGESLEPNRLLSLYLALVANRSRERSSERRLRRERSLEASRGRRRSWVANRLHYGVTKMADDNRPEAKLPQSLDKDFLIEKCSGRPSVEKLLT